MKKTFIVLSVISAFTLECNAWNLSHRLETSKVFSKKSNGDIQNESALEIPESVRRLSAKMFEKDLEQNWFPTWKVNKKDAWAFLNNNPSKLGIIFGKHTVELVVGAEVLCQKYWRGKTNLILCIATLFEISALEIAYKIKDFLIGKQGSIINGSGCIDARRWAANATIPELVTYIRQTARNLIKFATRDIQKAYGQQMIDNIFDNISTEKYIERSEARMTSLLNKFNELQTTMPKDNARQKANYILTKDIDANLKDLIKKMSTLTKDEEKCIGVLQGFQYSRTFLVEPWINLNKLQNLEMTLLKLTDYLYQFAGFEQISYAMQKNALAFALSQKSAYINSKLSSAITQKPTLEKLEAYLQIRTEAQTSAQRKIIKHIDKQLYADLADGTLNKRLTQKYSKNRCLYKSLEDFNKKLKDLLQKLKEAL